MTAAPWCFSCQIPVPTGQGPRLVLLSVVDVESGSQKRACGRARDRNPSSGLFPNSVTSLGWCTMFFSCACSVLMASSAPMQPSCALVYDAGTGNLPTTFPRVSCWGSWCFPLKAKGISSISFQHPCISSGCSLTQKSTL